MILLNVYTAIPKLLTVFSKNVVIIKWYSVALFKDLTEYNKRKQNRIKNMNVEKCCTNDLNITCHAFFP